MSEALTIATPDLAIEISGKIVTSNFHEFQEGLVAFIESIPSEMVTDEDFGNADQSAKILKNAEASLSLAKQAGLEQAEQIQTLFAEIDGLSEKARSTRLPLEKAIRDRKEQIRMEIITEAADRVDVVNKAPVRLKITQACKGKRSLDTMRAAANACADELAEELAEVRETIRWYVDSHGKSIAPDIGALEGMQVEALKIEFARRIERLDAEAEQKALRKQAAEAEAKVKKHHEFESTDAKGTMAPAPEKVVELIADKPTSGPDHSRSDETELAEWERFKARVISAFGPIKEARATLSHEANKAKAAAFAKAVGAAWKEARA